MNDIEYRSILCKAICTYGKEAQTLMFFEEVAEPEKELCKNARGKQNRDEILEEVADVEIMLEQIKIMHALNVGAIERVKAQKVQRLNERLQ